MPWLLDDAGREAVEARLVGTNRERMLRQGVEAVTELSLARPVVLVVEDLQWSDLATVDLMAALGLHPGPARLAVLATMRPPAAAPGDATQAMARYLESRLPGGDVPGGLAASLHARTGGIPLFLEKAVDGWIEDGRAVPADGGWRLTAGAAALSRDIPSTLRGLIRRRLDPLDQENRRLLETAGVAAPAFSAALVAAALDAPETHVEERIDVLATSGVMLSKTAERWCPRATTSRSFSGVASPFTRNVIRIRSNPFRWLPRSAPRAPLRFMSPSRVDSTPVRRTPRAAAT